MTTDRDELIDRWTLVGDEIVAGTQFLGLGDLLPPLKTRVVISHRPVPFG